jgi:hypothetical protein
MIERRPYTPSTQTERRVPSTTQEVSPAGGVGPIIYTTTTSTSDAKKWEYVSKDADTLYPLKIFIGSSALHGWSSEDVWPDSSVYLARSKLPDDPILVRFWHYLARSNCIMLCYAATLNPRFISHGPSVFAHLYLWTRKPRQPLDQFPLCANDERLDSPLPWLHGATRHTRLHTRVDEDHKTRGPTGTTHQKVMEEREADRHNTSLGGFARGEAIILTKWQGICAKPFCQWRSLARDQKGIKGIWTCLFGLFSDNLFWESNC